MTGGMTWKRHIHGKPAFPYNMSATILVIYKMCDCYCHERRKCSSTNHLQDSVRGTKVQQVLSLMLRLLGLPRTLRGAWALLEVAHLAFVFGPHLSTIDDSMTCISKLHSPSEVLVNGHLVYRGRA